MVCLKLPFSLGELKSRREAQAKIAKINLLVISEDVSKMRIKVIESMVPEELIDRMNVLLNERHRLTGCIISLGQFSPKPLVKIKRDVFEKQQNMGGGV